MFLSPIGNSQTIDENGNPLVGGTIETYLAGTSTPATTYTSEDGGTAQGPVITLNSLGLPTLGPVWMAPGAPLKFIFKTAAGVVLRTFDNIVGIGDVSFVSSEWQAYAGDPTYISATSFSVVGDQRGVFQVNRRIYTQNTGGTVYSTILTSNFSAVATAITLANDSGALDSGLSVVYYSTLSAENTSVPGNFAKLNSPALTGTPTAPTATPGTNTDQLATMAALTANGVRFNGVAAFSAGASFTAADIGKLLAYNTGAPGACLLPVASTISGTSGVISIINPTGSLLTINRAGSDTITGVGSTSTSISLQPGESVMLASTASNSWLIFASNRLATSLV